MRVTGIVAASALALALLTGCRGQEPLTTEDQPESGAAKHGFAGIGTEVHEITSIDQERKVVRVRLVPRDDDERERQAGRELVEIPFAELERFGGSSLREVPPREGDKLRITRDADGRIQGIDRETETESTD